RTGRTTSHGRAHGGGRTTTGRCGRTRTETGPCHRRSHRLAAGGFGSAAARRGTLVEFDVVIGFVGLFLTGEFVTVLADRPGLLPGSESTADRGESAREGRPAEGRVSTTTSSGNSVPRGGWCRVRGDRAAAGKRVG